MRYPYFVISLSALMLPWLASVSRAADATKVPLPGKSIYVSQCADCHGDQGEGNNDAYSDALVGDLSIAELTQIITDTMPEGEPETCVGEDARAVAQYIHEAFYSPAAQVRNHPPRTRLSRLTGQQLRQSLADLYGYFGADPWTTTARGLRGTYYTGRGGSDQQVRIDRVDDQIDFDFGSYGPGDGVDPQEYFVRWSGSLLAPRSGAYEIVVRSTCSFKMQFARFGSLFIDNHVQSAGKEEFRRSIHLTGGRVYPIQIDLQQRKRKTEQPPVRISLRWVPPQSVEQTIPEHYLVNSRFPAAFALQSKLPPDDSSYGYPRGIAVDRSWDQSTTQAATEFADVAADELFPAYRKGKQGTLAEVATEFLHELLVVAFRGPLEPELQSAYIDQIVAEYGEDVDTAIRHVILKCIKSPRFLYPTLDAHQSPSRRSANRLALVLYDSLPADAWLIDQAGRDDLESNDSVRVAADRMARDYRANAKLRRFLYHWLDLNELTELVKDAERFPGYDDPLVADLKQSFDLFLDHVIASEASDFRELLTADWAPTNDRLARFYGPAWHRQDDNWMEQRRGMSASVREPQVHVGVLTHPLLMSHFANHQSSSPIHRGVFLARYVLGRTIRPPQEAFTPFDESLHPELTTRQRIALQTSSKNCQVCHKKINALGFSLENFDAAGRFRQSEFGKPIDASGQYQPRHGDSQHFEGARELGDHLIASVDCHEAFVASAFEYFVKQPVGAYGTATLEMLVKSFRENDYNMRALIVDIAMVAATATSRLPK